MSGIMNWIAQKSEQTLLQTGRFTVVVQDNGSAHTSHLAREQWQQWQSGMTISLFSPPIQFTDESD